MTPEARQALADARARTLDLLAPFSDDALTAAHSPLMSPLVWDLAHVAYYEELWLLRELGCGEGTDPRFDDVYDAFRHPRAERPHLELLDPTAAREFGAAVRARVVAARPQDRGDPRVAALLADDFVVGLVVRHEHQHIETMLATIQLMAEGGPAGAGDGPGAPSVDPEAAHREVRVPAGPVVMGTDADPWAYDNERPAHAIDLPAFRIDATPVTNGAYRAFVDAGGYADPRWWTDAGWAWRTDAQLEHPQFWQHADGIWVRSRFGRVETLPDLEPVQHVGWYEADAFARWAGKRLPTEAEWEKAASWDAGEGRGTKRARPWDDDADADPIAVGALWHDGRRWGPDEVGARPAGATPAGVHDLLGGVWEWTASDFTPYPGFESFPYREYSEVFFGPEYKVLRGGSWATHPSAVSTTFRNWDFPIRRQIFSGFRCARDV